MSYQYDTVPRAVEQPESEFSAREVSHYLSYGSSASEVLPAEFCLLYALARKLKRSHEARDFVRFSPFATTMSHEFQAMFLSLELNAVAPLFVRENYRITLNYMGVAVSLESVSTRSAR
ncbi:hypothetical protein [Leucobacter chromiireducens]|uniref:hypothetical protein n=1 Tax=Leucobacter chromiireducens TaxID=283877 RepID=UPI0019292EC7|nr:hypothetical protein [Leucobacter chromiireducens]